MSESARTGRRTATRRLGFNPTVVIGFVLVVLTVGALMLVEPHEPEDRSTPPQKATLTSSSVGCPAALAGAGTVSLATGSDDVDGTVTLTGNGEPQDVPLRSGRVSSVDATAPVAVTGEAELAPRLLAARFGGTELAAVDCSAPSPETWFTGVGAGARHDSVVELVNPDEGPAVADITVYGRGGQIDVPPLRGVTVSGHDSVQLRLGELAPRRSELALRIVVSRGRLAASLLDQIPELGARPASEDFIPGQAEPARSVTLLGLPPGEGTDVLAVANPGEDEARVEVKVVTADSTFAPAGLEEVRVPPGAVRTVSLSSVLREAIRDGALGLEVTASAPVTSTLRSVVGDDLSHAAPVDASGAPMTLLVPPGVGRVLLADAGGVGVATVESWDADGKQLASDRLELSPGQGGVVDLPRGAALVRVTPDRTTVRAAALITGPSGAAVLGFRELPTEALIPDVRPGLP
jgi:hypothetical protein